MVYRAQNLKNYRNQKEIIPFKNQIPPKIEEHKSNDSFESEDEVKKNTMLILDELVPDKSKEEAK